MSMSDSNSEINLKDIIENTKYGSAGMGGIITKGTMYRGYPRWQYMKLRKKCKKI